MQFGVVGKALGIVDCLCWLSYLESLGSAWSLVKLLELWVRIYSVLVKHGLASHGADFSYIGTF